ncbi:hypothetical protein [Hansschlegelia sp.]|uniref:hypothetical protein n=1 Tax=Hansschlegelia sp. TaxID=2041892 RepID=UPI002BB60C87|nr:hypothetical protein [Hansschlegelia sp.]HVI28095.1 hypothetical protein [Hansschlegelia sp.]
MQQSDDENLRGRIDDLEAMVNGLVIAIAARDIGVTLDTRNPKVRDFYKANVARPWDARLQKSGAMAGNGYHDAGITGRIEDMAEKLKADLGPERA